MRSKLFAALLLGLLLSGCASKKHLGPDYYSREEVHTPIEVKFGRVLHVRGVEIGGTRSGIGAGAVGAVGTIAGLAAPAAVAMKLLAGAAGGSFGSAVGSNFEEHYSKLKGVEVTVVTCDIPPKHIVVVQFSKEDEYSRPPEKLVRVYVPENKKRSLVVPCKKSDKCEDKCPEKKTEKPTPIIGRLNCDGRFSEIATETESREHYLEFREDSVVVSSKTAFDGTYAIAFANEETVCFAHSKDKFMDGCLGKIGRGLFLRKQGTAPKSGSDKLWTGTCSEVHPLLERK